MQVPSGSPTGDSGHTYWMMDIKDWAAKWTRNRAQEIDSSRYLDYAVDIMLMSLLDGNSQVPEYLLDLYHILSVRKRLESEAKA